MKRVLKRDKNVCTVVQESSFVTPVTKMIPRLLMFLTLAVTSCHGQRKMPSNCSELLIDGDNKVDKMIPNFNKYDVGYKDVNDFDQRYCR